MSIKLVNQCIDLQIKTAAHKLVLIVLCSYANKENECWPSLDTLSKKTGYNKSTVARIMKNLEKTGAIQRAKGGGRLSTLYVINLQAEMSHNATARA